MKKTHMISKSNLRKIVKEEMNLAKKEFLLEQQLNEGILDFLGGIFGSATGGMVDSAKAAIGRWLLNSMGVNSEGLLGETLVNVFENMELSEMWSIISGDRNRCPQIARELLEAFGETLLERLPETFGIEADGWFSGIIREMITNSIIRDNQLVARIAEAICNMDIGGIFQSGGATEDQASTLERALGSVRSGSRPSLPAGASTTAASLAEVRRAKKYLNEILLEKKIR